MKFYEKLQYDLQQVLSCASFEALFFCLYFPFSGLAGLPPSPTTLSQTLSGDVYRVVSKRCDDLCNFATLKTWPGDDTKLVYRHYATLYFVVCCARFFAGPCRKLLCDPLPLVDHARSSFSPPTHSLSLTIARASLRSSTWCRCLLKRLTGASRTCASWT